MAMQLKPLFQRVLTDPILAAWLIGGLLAIFIPMIRLRSEKQQFYKYVGQWNEYNNNQNNQNNNNNNNNQNYNYNPCKWYQWTCKKLYNQNYNNNNYNNNGGGGSGDNDIQLPGWYTFFGGETEEERRYREESGDTSNGSVTFIYVWTLILFMGLLAYGALMLYQRRPVWGPVLMLLMFANFCFIMMLMLVDGVIETEGRAFEESTYGWYGQPGVAAFINNLSYLIFCLIFLVLLGIQAFCNRRKANGGEVQMAQASPDYQPATDYQAPQVKTGEIA